MSYNWGCDLGHVSIIVMVISVNIKTHFDIDYVFILSLCGVSFDMKWPYSVFPTLLHTMYDNK